MIPWTDEQLATKEDNKPLTKRENSYKTKLMWIKSFLGVSKNRDFSNILTFPILQKEARVGEVKAETKIEEMKEQLRKIDLSNFSYVV